MSEGIPFDPRNMTPQLAQELQAASIVEEIYGVAKEFPRGMGIIALAQMRESGNRRLARISQRFMAAFDAEGELIGRAFDLGWSTGYMYHHELALIRVGKVPVIGLHAFVRWEDEHNTEKALERYIWTNLPKEDRVEWVNRNIDNARDELGLALGGLIAQIAFKEGFAHNPDTHASILSAGSRINRLFLIQQEAPEV